MASKRKPTYRLPALWNCWDYPGDMRTLGDEIAVHPADYLAGCLDWIRAHSIAGGKFAGRSLSRTLGVKRQSGLTVHDDQGKRRAGDWIRRATMYGMMIRAATAWDHDHDGRLSSRRFNELGTFLKSILLLPHLHRLGVDVLYLLPVVKVSHLYRKGELGCPYSAKNFFELDPDQYDDAFGETYGDLNAQFGLFVESAHRLGMRVMLDMAPRTAARDADWILEHPEWFYWIDRKFARDYKAPYLPGVTYLNPDPKRLHEIYDVPAVHQHLAKFCFPPSVTSPQRWRNFAAAMKRRPPKDLLAETAKTFGVITPPGFSDVINDLQPPWSDVTYLRLFEDHPAACAKHLPEPAAQPPYVLYDTAKASLFEGLVPHQELWNRLADIIPFYQKFGVDGARVDMAHALPQRLEEMILRRPRERDSDFCFLAEQLGIDNHAAAHRSGYNIIIGNSWWMQPRSHEGRMHEFVGPIPRLKTPVMAAAETPDTPRATARRGQRRFAMQAIVVNAFLPNAVPMVNGGMEVFERQPMNLGLDAKTADRFALPKKDPFYGKLAFFDKFALHWTNRGGRRMTALIADVAAVRAEYLDVITRRSAYFAPQLAVNRKKILATGFKLPRKAGAIVMLANFDFDAARRTSVGGLPVAPEAPEVLLSVGKFTAPAVRRGRLNIQLDPGAAVVIKL